MKQFVNLIAILISTTLCAAQDFKEEFNRYCQEGDTVKQKEVLERWEKQDPLSAELYTSYFNFFFQRSRKEILLLTTGEPSGESLSLVDSTGKTAGHIGSEVVFDENIVRKGLDKIEEGIKRYPDRLDMRFGKIYVLGEIRHWKEFTDEIVNTVQYSGINHNRWTWTDNIERNDGKNFFLSSLQDYQVRLYNTGEDGLLQNMATIATEVLKIYPEHVESLSNLSIAYLLTGKHDNAIEILLKAEKIAPKDAIILGNIAQAYKLKGNKKKAIEYYKKTMKFADRDMAEYARKEISELEK